MEPPAIRRGGGEDLISGLPDELLHTILVRLQSAAAAARTSVLSRRWRGVWAHMPELVLGGSPAPSTPPSALLDSIDAALKTYAAPTVHSLEIELRGIGSCDVRADRVASWLRFASRRHAGKVHLRVHMESYGSGVVALPIFERATEIELYFVISFVLRPPPNGSFSALTDLRISCRQMDGGELGRVVSSAQCPRLRKLDVFATRLEPVHDVSVRSVSLECLEYNVTGTAKLEVDAPMLRDINVSHAAEACVIVAPKLEKVQWSDRYDPGRHHLTVAGRHLRSLCISHSTWLGYLRSSTQLMKQFDTVSELTVSLSLYEGIEGYVTFLKEMHKLPVCETLVIYLMVVNHHVPAAIILHLLRRCCCIRKLKLYLDQRTPPDTSNCTASDCPCLLPENHSLDDITFDSLEEIRITFFTGLAEEVEFVELLLSRCNTVTTLKRVDFTVPFVPVSSEIMEVVQRISSICHPNSKVQFKVHAREVPKL